MRRSGAAGAGDGGEGRRQGGGREAGGAQGGAALGEGEAGAGEPALCGAVDDGEEAAGERDQGLGPVQRLEGEGLGAMEQRGAGLPRGQRGEKACGDGGDILPRGEHMPLVVNAERALADTEAKLRAHAHDDLGVGAVFILEPEAQAAALGRAQALQLGIAADFARRAGAQGRPRSGGRHDIPVLAWTWCRAGGPRTAHYRISGRLSGGYREFVIPAGVGGRMWGVGRGYTGVERAKKRRAGSVRRRLNVRWENCGRESGEWARLARRGARPRRRAGIGARRRRGTGEGPLGLAGATACRSGRASSSRHGTEPLPARQENLKPRSRS